MSKLLFVVHRYHPFPGGSEYFVKGAAEEMVARGHDVTVVTHQHEGDLVNGVKVTDDYRVIPQQWDLIIVHGGDCISQDMVHKNATLVKSPVLYMIIKPSKSQMCLHGLKIIALSDTTPRTTSNTSRSLEYWIRLDGSDTVLIQPKPSFQSSGSWCHRTGPLCPLVVSRLTRRWFH